MSDLPRSATVLIVDDVENNRIIVRKALEKNGYAIVEAADGDTAIEQCAVSKPDLVLLDIEMPGKDGFEVCRFIKGAAQLHNTAVVMLTARASVSDKVAGIQAGADEFLTKPVDATELQTRVRAMLQARFDHLKLIEANSLLRRVLMRWHNRSVIAKILEDESLLRPGGSRANVSVLFADLSGFTRFSERAGESEVMDALNEAFWPLTRLVEDNGGTSDKYIGDCLMAFYGAPIATEDHAFLAVHTAFEMQGRSMNLRSNGATAPARGSGSRSGSIQGKQLSATSAQRSRWATRSLATSLTWRRAYRAKPTLHRSL